MSHESRPLKVQKTRGVQTRGRQIVKEQNATLYHVSYSLRHEKNLDGRE